MKAKNTEVLRKQRAKPKPDLVNRPRQARRPVRTARTIVQRDNGTQHCNTETVLLIFPLLQTNTTSKTWWPSGGTRGITNYM